MKGEKRFRGEMVRARSSHFLATGAERANELIRRAKSRPVPSAIDARAHAMSWHNPLAFLVPNPQSAESHPPINEREMRERTSSRRAQKASERDLVRWHRAEERNGAIFHWHCVSEMITMMEPLFHRASAKSGVKTLARADAVFCSEMVWKLENTLPRAHAVSENQLGRVEKVCAPRKRDKLAFSVSLRTSPNDVLVEWKEIMLFLVSAARGDFFLACWRRLPKLGWELCKMAFVLKRGSKLSHCQIPWIQRKNYKNYAYFCTTTCRFNWKTKRSTNFINMNYWGTQVWANEFIIR